MKKVICIAVIFFSVSIAFGQRWATDEENEKYRLEMLAENKRYKDSIDRYWDSINAKDLDKYKATIIKKYGKKLGTKIAEGEIEVGFSKKMCEDAWGTADTMRKDGNVESWYYRKLKTALTFKANKLIQINEL